MRSIFLALLILASCVFAEAQQRDPKIGYAYPAGGQRGTTVEILLGGRQIARATDVLISGDGVQGRVLAGYSLMQPNNADERAVIQQVYEEARQRYLAANGLENDAAGRRSQTKPQPTAAQEEFRKNGNQINLPEAKTAEPAITPEEAIRRYPHLAALAEPTRESLQRVLYEYLLPRPDRKPKETIAQGVLLEITIAPDAEPGDRALRLITPLGVTPPIRFVVGSYPEVLEIEPNDTDEPLEHPSEQAESSSRSRRFVTLPTLPLPVVVNGQVRSGDVDRFHFRAEKGRSVVVALQARHLVPFLADAVPGWFQGMVTLLGPDGRRIGSASSYRFEADPLFVFDVPEDGIYTVEVRDTLFRGRDDFVYRLSLGELPLVTSLFPLGGRAGDTCAADIKGLHLPEAAVLFDTSAGGPSIRRLSALGAVPLLRPVLYAVDDLPEMLEPERKEEPVPLPQRPIIVNGRIDRPNEIDAYRFTGRRGESVVLEVTARSLGSPLDATVELLDASGRRLAINDDRADSRGPNIGRETHHADPYLMVTLPDDGDYTIRLYNTLQRGGPEYAYRLRVSAPRPDFAVYCEPSAVNFSGTTQPITFHLVRQDGYAGPVVLQSPPDALFRLQGAQIPPGANRITCTITATGQYDGRVRPLRLHAVGWIGKETIHRPVTPVDDDEQAFIYHHLVPTEALTVYRPRQRGNLAAATPVPDQAVTLRPGDVSTLKVTIPAEQHVQRLHADELQIALTLQEPPRGVTLRQVEQTETGWSLALACAEDAEPGQGNLIIALSVPPDTTKPPIPLGVLQAVEYRILGAK